MALFRVGGLPRSIPATMTDSLQLARLLARAETVLERFEATLPPAPPLPDWKSAVAFRWRKNTGRGWLQAVRKPHPIRLAELNNIDDQKTRIVLNTQQFVAGRPANLRPSSTVLKPFSPHPITKTLNPCFIRSSMSPSPAG